MASTASSPVKPTRNIRLGPAAGFPAPGFPAAVENSTALIESQPSVGVASPIWIVTPPAAIPVMMPCMASPLARRIRSSVRGWSRSAPAYPLCTIPASEFDREIRRPRAARCSIAAYRR